MPDHVGRLREYASMREQNGRLVGHDLAGHLREAADHIETLELQVRFYENALSENEDLICGTCDGSGEIWGVWSDEHKRLVNILCPECAGVS